MSDHTTTQAYHEPVEQPLSVSHLFRTLRAYLPVILLALAAVAIGYLICAAAYYLLAPAQRVTSLPFRVQFEGAEIGQYPNGAKFSSTDIISAPVLTRTFEQNDLGRFTTFSTFSKSLFVVESNVARDALRIEYQARLSDPRLTSVDRERIQREYELKLSSLSKNEFALQYLRKRGTDPIPEVVAKKVLHDILRNWANFASKEQHVLEYRVAVLSPDTVAAAAGDEKNPIIAAVVLRGKVLRLLQNIQEIRELPNAELLRTEKDGLSLRDIAVRIDDLVRYRIDPLVGSAAGAGLDDRAQTIGFLTAQLAYDQRQLDAQMRSAEAAQRTLGLYMNTQQTTESPAAGGTSRGTSPGTTPGEGEAVISQINDSFIDRLIQLTAASADIDFRKGLAEDYRQAALQVVPLEQSVAYDRSVLELVRGGGMGSTTLTRESTAREIASVRADVRQLASKVNEIYLATSRSLNPSTELLAIGAVSTRLERTASIKQLALWGIVSCALALVLAVALSLLHSRVREEEAAESVRLQTV